MGGTDFSQHLSDDADLWGDGDSDEAPAPERPLPPHLLEPPPGARAATSPPAPAADARSCAVHPQQLTTTACGACGRGVCGQCRVLSGGKVLCRSCRVTAEWRPPRLLRLSVGLAGLLFALSLGHRAFKALRPAGADGPVAGRLPDPLGQVTWAQLETVDGVLRSWCGVAAFALALVALLLARGAEGQTWRVAWRVLLVVLLGGAAALLFEDPVVAALFR